MDAMVTEVREEQCEKACSPILIYNGVQERVTSVRERQS
tara:strand:- start:529 stop:645 length:117 start_codon:yes stop_codon:yes gene_type:complete